MASTPELTLNGIRHALDGIAPDTSALDWIRSQGLAGAKEGCAEGECGACAILVLRPVVTPAGGSAPVDGSRVDGENGSGGASSVWTAINSCLVPVASLAGQEIVTAEGLGTSADLHPAQREMAADGGSQCGYCTPGFVVSIAAEYYRADRVVDARGGPDGARSRSEDPYDAASRDAEPRVPGPRGEVGPNGFDLHALSGNLCRCTGYRPILDAAYALGAPAAEDPLARRRALQAPEAGSAQVTGPQGIFVRPSSLADALAVLAQRPEAAVVAGSTDRGVEVNLRGLRSAFVVGIDRVPELREFRVTDDWIDLGAALTLTEIERGLAGRVPVLDELFELFASRLIRNSATLGGNIGTASPIGDSPPVLLALGASVVLARADGEREVPLESYFTGYRQTALMPGELIRTIRIPRPLPALTGFRKVAKRRFDDISSVAVGFGLDVADGVVCAARIGLGGVAATPIRARATEEALVGRAWSEETVAEAARVLCGEGTPIDDHRASAAYRSAMLGACLRAFYAEHSEPTAEAS